MTIAEFSVKRPVTVIMRIAALVLLGVICFTKLPVDLLPKVTLPTINISTTWPNVAPEEIEAQITRPVEQAMSSVPGLRQITSTSSAGSSSVRVQFTWGTDIGQAAIDVMQRLERAKRAFPNDDTLQNPTVNKFDPNSMPILTVGFTGEASLVKLRMLLDNQATPILESAEGVAAVNVSGGLSRAIIVNVDPVKLRAYGLSLADVMRRLVQENINAPAGIARQSDTEYTIRSLGWITDLAELRGLPLTAPGGKIVPLSAVADVRDDHPEQRVLARMDGSPAVNVSVTKQSDANTVTTVEAVKERLEQVKKSFPGINYRIVYDQSEYVKNSIDDLKRNVVIGGVLAVLILLFFLRNVRSTLVVALSIPTSIISTFALLYLCGFTLNTMSLSGLALATGLIVDDAVVVLENIFRHIERDKHTPRQAAIAGTTEIMSAVFASTWTVMVVFLPLLFIKGQSGQMFTQFALVVVFSLAVSLLDAATVVPMLATRLISGEAHAELLEAGHDHPSWWMRLFATFGRWFDAMDEAYRRGLGWAMRHRWLTLGGALAFTGVSLLLLPHVGYEPMPATDTGDINVSFKLPPGTALAKTDRVMRQVEEVIERNPNVETAFATVGGGRGPGGSSVSSNGSVSVRLKPDHKQPTQAIIADLRRQLMGLPGVRPNVSQRDIVSMLMTGGDQNIEIDIMGNNLGTLSKLSKAMMAKLREVHGLENLDVNWQESMPEIQWQVDRQKAAQLGVTFKDVADTLATATNGTTSTYYQEDGFQYPIIVQVPEADRKTVAAMANLTITPASDKGRQILLSQVAHPAFANGPSQITRQDRQRYIAITGSPQGRNAGDIQRDVQQVLADFQMPGGYYWAWGANQKRQAEEFGGMGLAVVLAIGLIYMLLAAQFESLVHPLAILFSVPLASSGVVLGMFLTGRPFGLTALIGMLMLVGIVVKNGILLVDYTNTLRRRGMPRNEAILVASPTRLRPILMTASAAILGMLPIALALGKGSEIQAPMATAVIGGLITSTALTLFVVPIVYSFLDDLVGWHVTEELNAPEALEPHAEPVEETV
jgi:HAE1 family hydrophobic/amphiphilic exporter-1